MAGELALGITVSSFFLPFKRDYNRFEIIFGVLVGKMAALGGPMASAENVLVGVANWVACGKGPGIQCFASLFNAKLFNAIARCQFVLLDVRAYNYLRAS